MLFQQAVLKVYVLKEPESLFHKVAGLQPVVLLKNILQLKCFPVNFHKFLKTFSIERL